MENGFAIKNSDCFPALFNYEFIFIFYAVRVSCLLNRKVPLKLIANYHHRQLATATLSCTNGTKQSNWLVFFFRFQAVDGFSILFFFFFSFYFGRYMIQFIHPTEYSSRFSFSLSSSFWCEMVRTRKRIYIFQKLKWRKPKSRYLRPNISWNIFQNWICNYGLLHFTHIHTLVRHWDTLSTRIL